MPKRSAPNALADVLAAATKSLDKRALSGKSDLFIRTATRMIKTHLTVLSKLPLDQFRTTRWGTNWTLQKPWQLRARHFASRGVVSRSLTLPPAYYCPSARQIRASIAADLVSSPYTLFPPPQTTPQQQQQQHTSESGAGDRPAAVAAAAVAERAVPVPLPQHSPELARALSLPINTHTHTSTDTRTGTGAGAGTGGETRAHAKGKVHVRVSSHKADAAAAAVKAAVDHTIAPQAATTSSNNSNSSSSSGTDAPRAAAESSTTVAMPPSSAQTQCATCASGACSVSPACLARLDFSAEHAAYLLSLQHEQLYLPHLKNCNNSNNSNSNSSNSNSESESSGGSGSEREHLSALLQTEAEALALAASPLSSTPGVTGILGTESYTAPSDVPFPIKAQWYSLTPPVHGHSAAHGHSATEDSAAVAAAVAAARRDRERDRERALVHATLPTVCGPLRRAVDAKWPDLAPAASPSHPAASDAQHTSSHAASASVSSPSSGPAPGPASGPGPESRVVLFMHGGAYVMGSPRWSVYEEFCSTLLLKLAAQLGGSHSNNSNSNNSDETNNVASSLGILSIDYRLAPEHLFPAPLEDALAAYTALLRRGVLPSRICLAGDSAGGNLALSLSLAISRAGLPAPAAVAVLSPWGDLACAGESVTTLQDADPMIPAAAVAVAARALTGRFAFPTASAAAAATVTKGIRAVGQAAHRAEDAVAAALGGAVAAAVGAVTVNQSEGRRAGARVTAAVAGALHRATERLIGLSDDSSRHHRDDAESERPNTVTANSHVHSANTSSISNSSHDAVSNNLHSDNDAVHELSAAEADAVDSAAAFAVLSHPLASPARATALELALLPPTLVQVGGREVLLSDALAPFEAVKGYLADGNGGLGADRSNESATVSASADNASVSISVGSDDGKACEGLCPLKGGKKSHISIKATTGTSAIAGSNNLVNATPAATSSPAATAANGGGLATATSAPETDADGSSGGSGDGGGNMTAKDWAALTAPDPPGAVARCAAPVVLQLAVPGAARQRAQLQLQRHLRERHEQRQRATKSGPTATAATMVAADASKGVLGASKWEVEVWPGMFHVFPLVPFLPESQAAMNKMAQFIINECGWHPEDAAN